MRRRAHAAADRISSACGALAAAPTSATPESANAACHTTELRSTLNVSTLPPSTCAAIQTMQTSALARSVQPAILIIVFNELT